MKKKEEKVFLGGTCNGSLWRDDVEKKLHIPYFNPVVPDWTEEARLRELEERENCLYSLYVITPKMKGFYSIAEVIDDCHNKDKKTIFCYLPQDEGQEFDKVQVKSLEAVGKLVEKIGGYWARDINHIIELLNNKKV